MRRGKVGALPPDVLEALNARLISGGFSGYEALSDWLDGMGYGISRSSLHRHGAELEAEFEGAIADARKTLALAKAARETGDDSGALMEAAGEIMQDNLLRASLGLKHSEAEPGDMAKTLSLISRAFADVGRFELQRRKWQREAQEKLIAEQKQKLAELGKSGTVDPVILKIVARDVYGIDP